MAQQSKTILLAVAATRAALRQQGTDPASVGSPAALTALQGSPYKQMLSEAERSQFRIAWKKQNGRQNES